MLNKLNAIDTTSTLATLPTGQAKDLNELWDDLIVKTLPRKDVVEAWHKVLMEYIQKNDAVFFMRTGAGRSGNSQLLRRGFYNTTDYGFGAVYCDNGIPAYFYSMAYDGFVPTLAEFEEVMHSRQFPCAYIQTPAERQYAAYFRGRNPGVCTKGYKIAHVFPAGEDYNILSPYLQISELRNQVFPVAINTDWDCVATDSYGTYHHRPVSMNKTQASQVRAFLVAHFIRMVHPINYFLVPKCSNRMDPATGKMKTNIIWHDGRIEKYEIGEDADLINFVSDKLRAIYGKTYDEFLGYIYPIINNDPVVNKTIDADYGIDVWQTKGTPAGVVAAPTPVSTAVTAAPVTSATATSVKPKIILSPFDPVLFKTELLNKKKAVIIWTYADGTQVTETWNATNFSASSNLKGNIQSKTRWRSKDADGLVTVQIIVT